MPSYRWKSPYEWLEDAIYERKISANEALAALMEFIDSDEIQDVFQAEMERDGYFEDLDDPTCAMCGERILRDDIRWGEPHVSVSGGGVVCDDCFREMI